MARTQPRASALRDESGHAANPRCTLVSSDADAKRGRVSTSIASVSQRAQNMKILTRMSSPTLGLCAFVVGSLCVTV